MNSVLLPVRSQIGSRTRVHDSRESATQVTSDEAPAERPGIDATTASPVLLDPTQGIPGGSEGLFRRMEEGIAWPTAGSSFWEHSPRLESKSVTLAPRQPPAAPRDPKSFHIVHVRSKRALGVGIDAWKKRAASRSRAADGRAGALRQSGWPGGCCYGPHQGLPRPGTQVRPSRALAARGPCEHQHLFPVGRCAASRC